MTFRVNQVIAFVGILIYTDSWKGYGDLKDLGYKHKERFYCIHLIIIYCLLLKPYVSQLQIMKFLFSDGESLRGICQLKGQEHSHSVNRGLLASGQEILP